MKARAVTGFYDAMDKIRRASRRAMELGKELGRPEDTVRKQIQGQVVEGTRPPQDVPFGAFLNPNLTPFQSKFS